MPPTGRRHQAAPARSSWPPHRRRLAAGLAVVSLLSWLVACTVRDSATPWTGFVGASPGPSSSRLATGVRLAGAALWQEPDGPAARQVAAWRAAGRAADAAAVRRIAEQPTAVWLTDGRAAQVAGETVRAAAAVGRLPVLVAYHLPDRDCGGHSAGGADDAAAYRTWLRSLVQALAGHPAVVILEPDAVPQAVRGCLDPDAATRRYWLLAEAVAALKANRGVRVYLDAGNPSWVDVDALVPALRRSGVTRADGFALNVSNFERTAANLAYGRAVSDRLGGAHFVVDTSRNGNGPLPPGPGDRHWCNPPGRALGEAPSTRTGHRRVDAYLWIKRPGESDGACGDGAPPAGAWWPEYALGLATN